MRSRAGLVLAWALGCAGAQRPAAAVCPGEVPTLAGMRPVDDAAALSRVVHGPGAGGLCRGGVFELTEPLTVHRVWSRARPTSRLGRWWALTAPEGPRERYRAAYVVCAEWSDLDAAVRCTLRPGTRVAVGPGQGATCATGPSYPASAEPQVFVAYEGDPAGVFADCVDAPAWP